MISQTNILELKNILEKNVPLSRIKINPLIYIIGMFFAKFNVEAYASLGFETFEDAFVEIANKFDAKKNTVKQTRDVFDKKYPWRQGHKRKFTELEEKFYKCLDKNFFDKKEMTILCKLILDDKYNGLNNYFRRFQDLNNEISDSKQNCSQQRNITPIVKTKYLEGREYDIKLLGRERNSQARQKCVEFYHNLRGCLCCEICGFDFERIYGVIGKGYIHVHHINPLSNEIEEREINPEDDLIPVCPNCHAMLHMKKENPFAFTVSELKKIIEENKK